MTKFHADEPLTTHPMKTKTLLAAIAAFALASCATTSFPVDSPNPLDPPSGVEPSAEFMHAENLQEITGPPVLNHGLR